MTHSVLTPEIVHLPGAAPSETDRLDPVADLIVLKSGTPVRVVPLRMRQLFRLLRIITRGGAQYIPMLREAWATAEGDDAAEVFGTQLLAVALIALPEAEDESVEFVQSVVEPAAMLTRNDKQSREHNASLRAALDQELYNPLPDDLVTIIEAVILNNKDDLVSLGKRLGAMMSLALKTGQTPDVSSPQGSSELTPPLSDLSPEPVTSSPPNTDGPTTSYSTSHFDG